MSVRRLAVLQWTGFLAGAIVWPVQHVLGYGVGEAVCSPGGAQWGISYQVWQLTLLSCAGLVVVAAEASALAVFRRTRGENFGDGPDVGGVPHARMHFFAGAALVANILFLTIMLLDGIGSSFAVLCRQS